MNLMVVLLMLSLFIFVVLLVLFCRYAILSKKCPSCFTTVLKKIQSKLFWNSLLRALLETYFATGIFFLFTMNSMSAQGQGGRVELLTWLATGGFLLVFPYFTFKLLFKR